MTQTSSELKVCIFCGARPNFMKVAPIIRIIKKKQNEVGTVKALPIHWFMQEVRMIQR